MGLWIQALQQVRATPERDESRSEQRKCGQKGPKGRREWEGARGKGREDALEETELGTPGPKGSGNGYSLDSLEVSVATRPVALS